MVNDPRQLKRIEEQLERISQAIEELRSRGKNTSEVLAMPPVEAALRLGVSLSTVKRMIARREVLTVTVGKRQMITATEINRLLSDGATPSQPAPVARWTPVKRSRPQR